MVQSCHSRAGAATEDAPLEIRLALRGDKGATQHTFIATKPVTFELAVRNTGDATLHLDDAVVDNQSSAAGELSVLTSTSAGSIGPGDHSRVVVRYQPADGFDEIPVRLVGYRISLSG